MYVCMYACMYVFLLFMSGGSFDSELESGRQVDVDMSLSPASSSPAIDNNSYSYSNSYIASNSRAEEEGEGEEEEGGEEA